MVGLLTICGTFCIEAKYMDMDVGCVGDGCDLCDRVIFWIFLCSWEWSASRKVYCNPSPDEHPDFLPSQSTIHLYSMDRWWMICSASLRFTYLTPKSSTARQQ